MNTMKLIALAALAATLTFGADEKVTSAAPVNPAPLAKAAPVVKIRALTKDEQLELASRIWEAGMLATQAEASPAVLAAKAAMQRRDEAVDKVRIAIGCKACGFNVGDGKVTVLEPPPPPVAAAAPAENSDRAR